MKRHPRSGRTAPAPRNSPRIDLEVEQYSRGPLSSDERRATNIDDLALLIYTSGTTGLPKAARVSHARMMQWSHWFAGMMEVQPADRMYNCLPMYHSVGGVQVPGAMLAGGGSVVIREKFSASQFWSDIVRWDCTLFQYIGELCRYLLHAAPVCMKPSIAFALPAATGCAPRCGKHSRIAFAFHAFSNSMRRPKATSPCSMCRESVEPSATSLHTWHIAFRRRWCCSTSRRASPSRNEQGFCICCAPNQAGEALGKIVDDPANIGSRFEGYTATDATREENPPQCVRSRGMHGFAPAT